LQIPGPEILAKGYATYGPWVWTLSMALVALGTVSWLLLRAKDRALERAEARVDALTVQLVAVQEKRMADRDTFQGRLELLARETNKTSDEVVRAVGELARQVAELPRRRTPPREGTG
jgi:hypothetical protein